MSGRYPPAPAEDADRHSMVLVPYPMHGTEAAAGYGVLSKQVPIDVELASIIALLWSVGINTRGCCQESTPGRAYIAFPTHTDALAFALRLRVTESDAGRTAEERCELAESFAARVLNGSGEAAHAPIRPWDWWWSAAPRPRAGAFVFSVVFPRSDLAEIRERLGVA